MLEPEYSEIFNTYKKAPTPENSGALLKSVEPIMRSAFKTYTGSDEVSPNIRSNAKKIVLDSLERYDPTRAKLRTHLMTQLQGLRRQYAQENQAVRLPERVALDQHWLHVASNELKDKLGRDPSDMELAESAGVSMKRLAHIRKANPVLMEGTLKPLGDEQIVEPPAVKQSEGDHWLHFIYHDLSPVDQKILEHTTGLNNNPILAKKDIAAKLRVSPSAVSQRLAKIQQMLNRQAELRVAQF